jgi:hypothetical protein
VFAINFSDLGRLGLQLFDALPALKRVRGVRGAEAIGLKPEEQPWNGSPKPETDKNRSIGAKFLDLDKA